MGPGIGAELRGRIEEAAAANGLPLAPRFVVPKVAAPRAQAAFEERREVVVPGPLVDIAGHVVQGIRRSSGGIRAHLGGAINALFARDVFAIRTFPRGNRGLFIAPWVYPMVGTPRSQLPLGLGW